MAGTALYDLDHTLIGCDSDHEWGAFLADAGAVDAADYRRRNQAFYDDYRAGPLDARAQRLVKLALAVGARSQGAVHSHARRALREGIPAEELLQVPLLAISSIGWSAAMAALAWIRDVTDAAH